MLMVTGVDVALGVVMGVAMGVVMGVEMGVAEACSVIDKQIQHYLLQLPSSKMFNQKGPTPPVVLLAGGVGRLLLNLPEMQHRVDHKLQMMCGTMTSM